jgi:hypothetical protein
MKQISDNYLKEYKIDLLEAKKKYFLDSLRFKQEIIEEKIKQRQEEKIKHKLCY